MTLNDLLQSALGGIERHQGDNPDPKLDALGRHIAVVLGDLQAAATSEASEPTNAKEPVIVEDQRSVAAPEVAPSQPTKAKEQIVRTPAKKRVVRDPRLKEV